MQTDAEDLSDLEYGDFPYSFTYQGSSNVGKVTVRNGCGPLTYTFMPADGSTSDALYVTLEDSVLTFAPTYDNALTKDGSSLIGRRGTKEIDVTLSAALASYDVTPVNTTFEVGFGSSETPEDCIYDEISFVQSTLLDARYTHVLGSSRSIDIGLRQKVKGCDAVCSVIQIDSRNNEVDRTAELELDFDSSVLIIDDDDFSPAEINSVYTIRVDCGHDQETEFTLEIVQDCADNEIAWTTSLHEIIYYPVSQGEELVKFGYTQTIPGCKVTCQYNPTDCSPGVCYMGDFSTELQQFYIRKDALSSTSEKHDSIVCTSKQN